MAKGNLHNSNALMAAYNQSKTIPPRKNSPGLQHWLNERHSMPAAQQVAHDGVPTPAGTGAFAAPKRPPTRPSPGSAYRRRKPRPS